MLEGMVLSLLMTSLMCVCKRCGTNIYSFLISYTVIGSYCAVFFFVRIKLFMYMVGI